MNSKKKEIKMLWWQPSLVLFGKLSGWIGGPIIAALFLGRWLDNRYGTEPKLFLLCVGVAFFVSAYGIVKDTLVVMKKIEDDAKKEKELKESAKKEIDSVEDKDK
jgi:hypothetical protein